VANTEILLITGYDLGWLSGFPWHCCLILLLLAAATVVACFLLAGKLKLRRITMLLGAAGRAHHDRNKHRFLLPNTTYGQSWHLK
jgi:hypothetical protein